MSENHTVHLWHVQEVSTELLVLCEQVLVRRGRKLNGSCEL